MNYMKEFAEHVHDNGKEGLLPQNLTDSMLSRMLMEVDDFENDRERKEGEIFILAIFSLKHEEEVYTNVKITFDSEDELADIFSCYIACLELEGIRRSRSLTMPISSLPTLKNIFDKNRKIQMSELN